MNNNGNITTDVRLYSLEIKGDQVKKSDKILRLKVKDLSFVICWNSSNKDLIFYIRDGDNKHKFLDGVTQYSNQVTEWLRSESRFKNKMRCSGKNSWLVLGGIWLEVIIQDEIIHDIRIPKESLNQKRITTKMEKITKIKTISKIKIVDKVIIYGTKKITCEVSKYHSVKMIYGRTQSGKTKEVLLALTQRMKIDKCCGLFLTRNYNSELEDQIGALKGYIDKFESDIEIIAIYAKNPKWHKVVESMRTRDSSKLYVLMGNSSSLTKLFNLMKKFRPVTLYAGSR